MFANFQKRAFGLIQTSTNPREAHLFTWGSVRRIHNINLSTLLKTTTRSSEIEPFKTLKIKRAFLDNEDGKYG